MLMNSHGNLVQMSIDSLKQQVRSSLTTTTQTYVSINPDLSVHKMYLQDAYVPDKMHISFTRLRTGSHRLRIETGRWSRVPRDERLCDCGQVQDEQHVLLRCPATEHLRLPCRTLKEIFQTDNITLAKLCHDILEIFNIN